MTTNTSLSAVGLRNIIVPATSFLQGAEMGQLSEGAIAQVITPAESGVWRFTKQAPEGTLANTEGQNYVQNQFGFWVSYPTRVFERALVAGVLTISDLYLASDASTGLGGTQVLVTHRAPGGTPGFINSVTFPTPNSVRIASSSTTDTSMLSVVIFPNLCSLVGQP